MTTHEIINEVLVERQRQDDKWGGPVHDGHHGLGDWALFIRERLNDLDRDNLVEIAALAVAAIESIDRKAEYSRRAELLRREPT